MRKSIILLISVFFIMLLLVNVYAQEIEDVKQQYQYAEQLLAANKPDYALREYLKVVYLYPDNELKESASYKVTECLIKYGNPWAAIESCNTFVEKYPNSKYIEEVRKRIITATKICHTSLGYSEPPSLSLREKVASKYISFGIEFLDSSESTGETGEKVYNKEKLDKAFYWFEKIIKEFPDTYVVAKAQYYKGMAYIKQERQADYKKAVEELQKVVDNYPNTIWTDEAQKKIGDIYKDNLVDKNRAIETYQNIIDRKKNNPDDYYVSYARALITYLK